MLIFNYCLPVLLCYEFIFMCSYHNKSTSYLCLWEPRFNRRDLRLRSVGEKEIHSDHDLRVIENGSIKPGLCFHNHINHSVSGRIGKPTKPFDFENFEGF